MERKHKFAKLDKLLQEEYDRRVQKIVGNLSDDGSFEPDRIDSRALLGHIKDQIQKDEGQKEWEEKQKEMRIRRIERRVCYFIIMVVGIFCVVMTSEANRAYLGDKLRYLKGNEEVIRVGGDEEEKSMDSEEEELLACQEIREKLGIPVPILNYGVGAKYSFEYGFFHEDSIAMIKYQYENMILDLHMVNKDRAEVSGMAFHGQKIKEVDVMGGLLTIPVERIKDTEDLESVCAAQWEYKNGYYQLSGKVGEKEFIEIVENISY